jgi:hypothetical protein
MRPQESSDGSRAGVFVSRWYLRRMRKSGHALMAWPGGTSDGACGGTSGAGGGAQHRRRPGGRRQNHRRGLGKGRRRQGRNGSRGQYRRASDMTNRAYAAVVPMIGRMCRDSAVRSGVMRVAGVTDRLRGQEGRDRRAHDRIGRRHGQEGGCQPSRQHEQRHQHAGHARAGSARAQRGDHRGRGLSIGGRPNPIMGAAVCIPAFPRRST